MTNDVLQRALALAEAYQAQREAERRQAKEAWRKEMEAKARERWARAVELEPELKEFEAAVQFEPVDDADVNGYPVLRIGDWPGIAVAVRRPRVGAPKVYYWVASWLDGEEVWLGRGWGKDSLGEALHLARLRADKRQRADEGPEDVCPLLSLGSSSHERCVGPRCAWWSESGIVGDGCAAFVLAELFGTVTQWGFGWADSK